MSYLKRTIRSLLARIVYYSGFFRAKLAMLRKDQYLVLMYHRIIPRSEGGIFLQPGMYVEPDTFDMHLDFLKRHFEIRLATELGDHATVVQKATSKPVCYITFDDGWADFYTYAYPILRKHNLPATVFLPTSYIGTDKIFWTDRLAAVFEAIVQCSKPMDLANVLACNGMVAQGDITCSPYELFEITVNRLKQFKEPDIIKAIDVLAEHFNLSPKAAGQLFLDWQQIKEMKFSGLVSFGSHTVTHRILTTLESEDVVNELVESLKCLIKNGVVNGENISFCYPNGCFDCHISNIVKDLGYRCAFTTLSGVNRVGSNNYELLRIPIHQDLTYNIPLLACKIVSSL